MKTLLLGLFLLAGCAGYPEFFRPGASSSELSVDKYYCERELTLITTDTSKRAAAMQTCMAGKGWALKGG
jgi:hypothetical protein